MLINICQDLYSIARGAGLIFFAIKLNNVEQMKIRSQTPDTIDPDKDNYRKSKSAVLRLNAP